MTGDGVNDVLALKDADCSVAMASGSQAAIQASQLVLTESDFSKMPGVVKEGRRVVNNLQCSGSLFLVKNGFSLITAIVAICFSMQYPIKPAQVSLISLFTIGIPAFLLSQAPNRDLIKGRFISNILANAIPGGLTDALMVELMVLCGNIFAVGSADISTVSTILSKSATLPVPASTEACLFTAYQANVIITSKPVVKANVIKLNIILSFFIGLPPNSLKKASFYYLFIGNYATGYLF
jgi:magnesium-transporting ATPase (P-type)